MREGGKKRWGGGGGRKRRGRGRECTVISLCIIHSFFLCYPSTSTTLHALTPAADSSSLKIPSWLKPVSGPTELSFEERRHSYMFSKKREKGERRRRSLKELQAMSLCERKLEILDSLLSSEQIQPIVIKLVSKHDDIGGYSRYLVHSMYMYNIASTSCMTLIGVHEMHGQMHPN